MTDVIVDTDILIDAIRNIPEAIQYLDELEQKYRIDISIITYMEILIGCRDKAEQRKLELFIRRFHSIKLNENISDQTTLLLQQYRLSHGLLIADALIAATALVLNIPIATKNQRDYRFIPNLVVLPYP